MARVPTYEDWLKAESRPGFAGAREKFLLALTNAWARRTALVEAAREEYRRVSEHALDKYSAFIVGGPDGIH